MSKFSLPLEAKYYLLAKRLRSVISGVPNEVKLKVKKDPHLKPIIDKMSMGEFITFVFIISLKDYTVDEVLNEVNTGLYGGKLVYTDGYGKENCPNCDGIGHESCEYCDGTGRADCETCDGSGRETCGECDGDGVIDDEGTPCDECQGGGDLTCSDCAGEGVNDCRRCGGDGDFECNECDGTGENSEGNPCNICDGEGEVECDECGGRGDSDCPNCYSGSETCPTCRGNGTLEGEGNNLKLSFICSWDMDLKNRCEMYAHTSTPVISSEGLAENNEIIVLDFSDWGEEDFVNDDIEEEMVYCWEYLDDVDLKVSGKMKLFTSDFLAPNSNEDRKSTRLNSSH